jgi:cupin fold WbuC family metalloprotein
MNNHIIPFLNQSESRRAFEEANISKRKRTHRIIHKHGAIFNQVFNFMLYESYMQPHMHPGDEKIEHMYLLKGEFKLIKFDEYGRINSKKVYSSTENNPIIIPANTWHTYVMTSNEVITYETMIGRYEPSTWKKMANWAPEEGSKEASIYLEDLRNC